MKEPLVSIVMATKDTDEKYLRESIFSILNQTFKNLEFLIIVDGSKRDLDIVKSFKDDRIKIFVNDITKGLAACLNIGIKNSRGKYIARMDSDDISFRNRIKVQIDFLEKNEEINICGMFAIYIGEKGGAKIDCFNSPKDKRAELFVYNNVIHPTIVIRKTFLSENGLLYNEDFKYAQDYELWTRCSEITPIVVINKFGIKYRIHGAQISKNKIEEQNKLAKYIYILGLEKMFDRVEEDLVNCLLVLSGKSKNTISKFELLSFINQILELNYRKKIYNQQSLKKILYYRFLRVNFNSMTFFEKIKFSIKSHLLVSIFKKGYYEIIALLIKHRM